MNLSTLAWKNLWRRKRRTLITGLSIGFGVLLSVTFTGTGDYMYTNMINTGASMGMGHVTLEAPGFNLTPTLDKSLNQAEDLREQVLSQPGVEDANVRILGQAMFASASKSVGGLFFAIDPQQEQAAYNLLLRSIVEGEVFTDSHDRGIVIGDQMATKLNLHLGKKIVYTTTDKTGEIVGEVARVRGIFHTGVDEVDGAMVLLPIDRVRQTLNYMPDEASMVTVLIRDQRHASELRDRLQGLVDPQLVEVLDWKQTQADLAGLIALDRSTNYLSQVLVGVIIAAGILNTLLMSVLERQREFGMMMAVGMSPATLFRLVILESFWMALFGLLVGVLITAPWFYYLHTHGIDFTEMTTENYNAGGVLIDPVIRIRLFSESVVAILVGVFTLTMIAGLYPAWRAVRTVPVESIKNI